MDTNEMLNTYNRFSPAHVYALAFVHAHNLFVQKLSFDELTRFIRRDRASTKKGGFAKLRVKLNAAARAELSATAERLGPDSLLTADPAHNKGENAERVITEKWTGKSWVKDSTPFWVAGDIRVDGVEIQIKLDGAELTNERVLGKLLAGLV